MTKQKVFAFLLLVLIFSGCATYRAKYVEDAIKTDITNDKDVAHTFYLIGDAGKSPMGGMKDALKLFKRKLDSADANSTAIFLGDNIYPAGMPDPVDSTEAYFRARNDIDAQIKTLENFKGKPFFIPGNHDWYTEGLIGLRREQDYIQQALDSEAVFFPEDGCPLKTIEVSDHIAIIAIDTEWYLTNWNKRPDMNDNCDIKSREEFWLELEDAIKDNRQRTTLIAMHHPMFSYGQHGGQYTFRQNLYPKGNIGPIPLIGTFIDLLRKTTGASSEDQQNRRYIELKKRLITLAQYSGNIILASGHEHTLQYIVEDNTPQIVSGAGSKMDGTRLLNGSRFSTGRHGYALLKIYTDGSSQVNFYSVGEEDGQDEDFMFTTQVLPPDRQVFGDEYPESFPSRSKTAIYSEDEIRNSFFKALWGERYRKIYTAEVRAPTVDLDTLMGGLKPVYKEGGHQSKSLHLRDNDGKEYVMHALKKDADPYLRAMSFHDEYDMGGFEETLAADLLRNFYRGSHPYSPLAVGPLSEAVGLYHTNPVLYYVPKQSALEDFNETFGDGLYLVEKYPGNGHADLESFGNSDTLKSTRNMLQDIRDAEKYDVDAKIYLRARLFDMAIGGWNRQNDPWRWAQSVNKETGKIVYRPVSTDRYMAFSKLDDEIRSTRGFNALPKTYRLDMSLLTETTLAEWQQQARFIRENLTGEVIDKALAALPEEVRSASIPEIKRILLGRLAGIERTVTEYYGMLNKYAVVTGTQADDRFEIDILKNNEIEIKVNRKVGVTEKQFFQKKFYKGITKEIWVYGLGGKDRFEVYGEHRSPIKVRMIGGSANDIYDLDEGGNIAVYDYRSKKNTLEKTSGAKVQFTNDYDTNTYLPLQIRNSMNRIDPTIGYNPDQGVSIGVSDTYTYNGFRKNPFSQKHQIDASFHFATSGFELDYSGEYAHLFENWNLRTDVRLTNPNFSTNFFGFGNESENFDQALDFDYNRVRWQTFRFEPSLVYRWELGAQFNTGISIESVGVGETQGRFINTLNVLDGEKNRNSFLGWDAEYAYSNSDNTIFPTLGMATSLQMGYKTSLEDGDNFGYVMPSFSVNYKLLPSGRLVLDTQWKAHFNIGDGYKFYQAANIGGDEGLRGFRYQRFTGKKSYYQSTDIRYSLRKLRTEILPVALGIYGGFDYGRVWTPNRSSNVWHTSYGGGLFLDAAGILSARVALFNSEEGVRFSFGLGFGF